MNRKLLLLSGLASATLMLGGCAENSFDALPPLTQQEEAVIEEYAVGTILSFSNANRRLATVAEITTYDEREALRNKALGRVPVSEVQDAIDDAVDTTEAVEETDGGATLSTEAPIEPSSQPFQGIARFCGKDGFEINYAGYSVLPSYPDPTDPESSSDLFFAMDATPGHMLLVVYFDAINTTGSDLELNMMDSGVKFKININGGASARSLTTLLLDDLSSYVGTISPGVPERLVLIREVPEDIEISQVGLTLQNENGSATTTFE